MIAKVDVKRLHHQDLIADIRKLWDSWDTREEEQNDERLQFDSFYHAWLHGSIFWMLQMLQYEAGFASNGYGPRWLRRLE